MFFPPKEEKDLFSPETMIRFFNKNCRFLFGFDKLISLKIFPQKRIAKNIVILYKTSFLKKGKTSKINIWGKTMSFRQFRMLEFIAKTKTRKYLPKNICYFKSSRFSLSEEAGGKSLRHYKNNLSFWRNNVSKIADMIAAFQELKFPGGVIGMHSRREENKFILGSLERIEKYSPAVKRKYEDLAGRYLKKLSSNCWRGKKFVFSHFDFQPGNIFYDKSKKVFKVLDFDLAKRFHPALDRANFWAHTYVMLRYHFPRKKILSVLGFSRKLSAGRKKTHDACFNVFKLRAIIDIAQITAAAFKKPSKDSSRVFKKLQELTAISL